MFQSTLTSSSTKSRVDSVIADTNKLSKLAGECTKKVHDLAIDKGYNAQSIQLLDGTMRQHAERVARLEEAKEMTNQLLDRVTKKVDNLLGSSMEKSDNNIRSQQRDQFERLLQHLVKKAQSHLAARRARYVARRQVRSRRPLGRTQQRPLADKAFRGTPCGQAPVPEEAEVRRLQAFYSCEMVNLSSTPCQTKANTFIDG